MKRTLAITTKAEATKVLNATPKARRFPYCTGKYQWSGTSKDWLGKELDADDRIKAIYVERRQDQHGPYAKIMCIVTY